MTVLLFTTAAFVYRVERLRQTAGTELLFLVIGDYTDKKGSSTGPAHLRSMWAACGPQYKISLTFLL